MSWLASNLLAAPLLPPFNILIFGILGCIIYRHHRPLGIKLIILAGISLWVGSTPLFANWLMGRLESTESDSKSCKPQAIVVLGAGTYYDAPEYGGDTVTAMGLERLRLAAALHHRHKLPILVSGGKPDQRRLSEGQLMKAVLESEFSATVQWMEDTSNNTKENALYSRKLLAKDNISNILLVTHAWHMPRSLEAFNRAGFCVTAAPTGFTMSGQLTPLAFLPRADALQKTYVVMHEAIGILWYRLTS